MKVWDWPGLLLRRLALISNAAGGEFASRHDTAECKCDAASGAPAEAADEYYKSLGRFELRPTVHGPEHTLRVVRTGFVACVQQRSCGRSVSSKV